MAKSKRKVIREVKKQRSTRGSPKSVGQKSSSLIHHFGGKVRLPLTPKRPDRATVRKRRASGRPVSIDRRFRNPVYLKAIRQLLIKAGNLVQYKKRGEYRIPLSEDKELDSYGITYTFRFYGETHDEEMERHKLPGTLRLLSTELETAANDKDWQTTALSRVYRYVWWHEAYALFQSGGIRSVYLDSVEVVRDSLSGIKKRESAKKRQSTAKLRREIVKNPRTIFGALRVGKKYLPRGVHGGEEWVLEKRRIGGKSRIVVTQRWYTKNGKPSRRRPKVLWKPQNRKVSKQSTKRSL